MALPLTIREVGAPGKRIMRHPQHPFQIRFRPWEITPFFIAPVLPGETMRNLLVQARVVSDPVKSSLVGWWYEKYFFYVKMRDLDGRDTFTAMMLDPTTSLAAFNTAANVQLYHGTGTISWVEQCLKRVTEWYFRYDDETWNTEKFTTLPIAKINQRSWLDSVQNDAAHATIADVNVDLNANATITAAEVDKALYTWNLLRTQGMTDVSYEDFLASYGVRPTEADLHKPELIRYVKDWTYPTVHVEPSTGAPSSALVWKVAERADKDRFFSEPGFLFGVAVARPKVYLSKQLGSATDIMTDLYAWLPPALRASPEASLRKIAAVTAPLNTNTDAYWVDVKDLFLYGEQFVNFALSATDAGLVALPTAALKKQYASSTDADGLFSAASPANQLRADGLVSLSIATVTADTTGTIR